jgi:uncharacterized protein (DUF924 family)
MIASRAQQVLDFWFGTPRDPAGPERGRARAAWFTKDPTFDARIQGRFGALVDEARAGGLSDWVAEPHSALALLLVCDQFPRNIYRDRPEAFSLDVRALALAREMVARGWDVGLLPVERLFAYLPFEHSESIDDQRESLRLIGTLREDPDAGGSWEWAVKHFEVIERFGRFPHRNAILGRPSTPQEEAFLRQPGSRF